MNSSILDAVDKAILHHLQTDARKPITDIADAVNVSDNTVRNRIQALEDQGIIEGYQVNINYDAAGISHYWLFTCSARIKQRKQLARKAYDHDSVIEVITLMTGKNNLRILGASNTKEGVTDLAHDLDDMGLDIESEYLIRKHDRQAFAGFRLDDITDESN